MHINEPIIVKNIESPTPDLIIPNDPENTTVEKDGKATLECKAKVTNYTKAVDNLLCMKNAVTQSII